MNHYNFQNKLHVNLFKESDRFQQAESQISWLDMLLYKTSSRLNGRVSRISPRRGKRAQERMVKGILKHIDPRSSEANELAIMLEETSE